MKHQPDRPSFLCADALSWGDTLLFSPENRRWRDVVRSFSCLSAMLELTATVRHMVNGNDTRFTPKKGIKLDERWRRELVGEELEYFERKGGAMNRLFGYT